VGGVGKILTGIAGGITSLVALPAVGAMEGGVCVCMCVCVCVCVCTDESLA
jgi:hypothetical protein